MARLMFRWLGATLGILRVRVRRSGDCLRRGLRGRRDQLDHRGHKVCRELLVHLERWDRRGLLERLDRRGLLERLDRRGLRLRTSRETMLRRRTMGFMTR